MKSVLRRRFSAVCALLLVLISGPAFGDTLYLRDGRRIQGTVLDQSRFHVRIRRGGRTIRVRKKSIRRITYGTTVQRAKRSPRAARKRVRRRRVVRKPGASPAPGKIKPNIQPRPNSRKSRIVAEPLTPPKRKPRTRSADQPFNALLRSALLPGAGQWLDGRREVALLAGVGSLTLAAVSLGLASSFQGAGAAADSQSRALLGYAAARGDLNTALAATIRADDANTERLRSANRARAAGLGALLFYLWNLADAYWFHSGATTSRMTAASDALQPAALTNADHEIRFTWGTRF